MCCHSVNPEVVTGRHLQRNNKRGEPKRKKKKKDKEKKRKKEKKKKRRTKERKPQEYPRRIRAEHLASGTQTGVNDESLLYFEPPPSSFHP